MLGARAVIGRLLLPEDDEPDHPRVVVLSYGVWQRRFAADRGLVGRELNLNGDSYTVVGILPPEFVIPNAEVDIAAPLRLTADPRRGERYSNFLRVLARLKPGVTIEQARADLETITTRLRERYPVDNGKHTAPTVLSLHDEITGGYRAALVMLLGAVGLVLMIACSNLAGLLLARAIERRREVAIRMALGAARRRVVRQLLTESILLSLVGGALGLLLTGWATELLLALSPADLPRAIEVNIDLRVLIFTAGASVLAGLIFGLAPAWHATRVDLNTELKQSSSSAAGKGRFSNATVVTQVALSLILIVNAGLLLRSFARFQKVSPGFETRGLTVARVSLPPSRYSKPETIKALFEKLAPRLRSLPGVESVGVSNAMPLSGMNVRTEFAIAGRPPLDPTDVPAAQNRWITPGYFQMMRIPLLKGREFDESDNERTACTAIIDEALARRYWPNDDPLGAHLMISFGGEQPRDFEIVGIVGNVKHTNLNEEATATLYAPLFQIPNTAVSFLANNMHVVVRGDIETDASAATIRRELKAIEPDAPASSVRAMSQVLSAAVAPRRFNLLLLMVFASVALMLAMVGLYAVLSYTVAQRSREIGIRLALGGETRTVFGLIIGQGMKLTITGVAIGFLASLPLTRVVEGSLFETRAVDPLTIGLTAGLLAAVGLVACYIPARRAARLDPLSALRDE